MEEVTNTPTITNTITLLVSASEMEARIVPVITPITLVTIEKMAVHGTGSKAEQITEDIHIEHACKFEWSLASV